MASEKQLTLSNELLTFQDARAVKLIERVSSSSALSERENGRRRRPLLCFRTLIPDSLAAVCTLGNRSAGDSTSDDARPTSD